MQSPNRRTFLRQSSSLALASLLPSSIYQGTPFAKTVKAKVHVNFEKPIGKIEPEIYGQFIEYLGRAITGGVVDAKTNLVRKDVLEKIKRLQTPLLRFPGGTVTKIYHWQDGIGPKNLRPVRPNLIWGGEESNQFGTNEFIDYCRMLKTDPFLVVNMNTGTPEEASNWVEYCNGAGNTSFASLRKKHGYPQAHKVKYWGLGNEESAVPDTGRLQDAHKYVEIAWQYAKLMKLQDPNISLVLAGGDTKWNEILLKELHPIADYISLHYYANSKKGQPASLFAHIATFEKEIVATKKQIHDLAPEKVENFNRWYRFPPRKKALKIALDEWGIWENEGKGAYNLEVTYQWFHALGVAGFLNIFQRQADIVGMATWAQTVNVLAPIMTNEKESICQTVFYPLELYRKYCKGTSITTEVESPALEQVGAENLGILDTSASYDEDTKTLTLAIVNRHPELAVETEIDFPVAKSLKIFEKHELTATSYTAANTLEKPSQNVVSYQHQNIDNSISSITLAPASITLLRFR
jgi:alpha-N-arabinofuranosidase